LRNRAIKAAMATAHVLLIALVLAGCAQQGVSPGSENAENQKPGQVKLAPEALIGIGMEADKVVHLVGKPVMVERMADKPKTEVWHYEFGIVIIQDQRVKYKYPPSKVGSP